MDCTYKIILHAFHKASRKRSDTWETCIIDTPLNYTTINLLQDHCKLSYQVTYQSITPLAEKYMQVNMRIIITHVARIRAFEHVHGNQ